MFLVARVNHAPPRDKGRILRAATTGLVLSDSTEEGGSDSEEDVDDSEGVRIQGVKYEVQLDAPRTTM